MKYVTNSAEETIEIGKSFAEKLNKGAVVLLSGEMGAGKTVFVKGMAQGLGIKSLITSPTYAYMNDYDVIPNGAIRVTIEKTGETQRSIEIEIPRD